MRRGRDLGAEGVTVVAMDGATNIAKFLERYGPRGADLEIAGLYDVGEEGVFRRALERAGFGTDLSRDDLQTLGFHVCIADLEDELIRALGVDAVEELIAAQGELDAFRTMQKQPAHRGRKHRGTAAAVHGHEQRTQDLLRAGDGRRARPRQDAAHRSTGCSLTSESSWRRSG